MSPALVRMIVEHSSCFIGPRTLDQVSHGREAEAGNPATGDATDTRRATRISACGRTYGIKHQGEPSGSPWCFEIPGQ